MRTRLLLAGLGAAILSVPLLTTGAGAIGTQLGATFANGGSPCSSPGVTVLQTSSPGNAYTVPGNGVITSWRYVPDDATTPELVALKTGRSVGSNAVVTGSSPIVLAGPDLVQQDAQIPVQAGDVIGFFASGGAGCGRTGTGYGFASNPGDVAPGGALGGAGGASLQVNLTATWEPDADGDGFGDLTQDRCSTDKSIQGTCPSDRTAPETVIGSVVAKKARSAGKKASVTATFSANETSTFECAVDSPVFVPCRSPFVVKLKVGKHSLAVRATDAAGNVDRSAAVAGVKVKVGKPRK